MKVIIGFAVLLTLAFLLAFHGSKVEAKATATAEKVEKFVKDPDLVAKRKEFLAKLGQRRVEVLRKIKEKFAEIDISVRRPFDADSWVKDKGKDLCLANTMDVHGRMVADTALKYGIPYEIAVALPAVESCGRDKAKNHDGSCHGLYMVCAGTAELYGYEHHEMLVPEKAASAGLQYLSDLYEQFDGDWIKALEAYNNGPGALGSSKWVFHQKVNALAKLAKEIS